MNHFAVLLRVVAAIGGGFGVTSLAVLFTARALVRSGLTSADAVVAAAMFGFLLYLALLLWGLSSKSLVQLWMSLALAAAGLAWGAKWLN